jgi:hypothetical protein
VKVIENHIIFIDAPVSTTEPGISRGVSEPVLPGEVVHYLLADTPHSHHYDELNESFPVMVQVVERWCLPRSSSHPLPKL